MIINGGATAHNVQFEGSIASSGAVCTTAMPLNMGDITAGGTHTETLTYIVPHGVAKYTAHIFASAQDECGTTYNYPEEYQGENIIPVLSWTGEPNYESDGVNPNPGPADSDFEFRVKYTDADNDAAATVYVAIDTNDNGSYAANEQYNMTADDASDAQYNDGKLYTHTIALPLAGDGELSYYFYASDGTDEAAGAPTLSQSLLVTIGGSHDAHVYGLNGFQLSCDDCHQSFSPPIFADGEPLESTSICDTCHSPDGFYDGVNDPLYGAKANFRPNGYSVVHDTAGNLKAGKEYWCIGCHDNGSSLIESQVAPDKAGDNSTFGYYITGHGRSAEYGSLSWQATSDTGNPGADLVCTNCHDGKSQHITPGTIDLRLKTGFENDAGNSDCLNCHDAGMEGMHDPQWYTNYDDYSQSAHSGVKCSECHDLHGTDGQYNAMTKADKENLCLGCHTKEGHSIGASFSANGKDYTLQCISCHNVHIITGPLSEAGSGKSPISLFSDNTSVWGDEAGEKMDDFAGSGTYRTPNGETLTGSELPNYINFCLDCHGQAIEEFGPHGGISWGTDEPHGLNSANMPNGGGSVPDWWTAGKALGWDGDACVGSVEDCWPVTPRGLGEQVWSRPPFNQIERISGANFVLSCSNCHVTHESGIGSKLSSTVNNGPGSVTWNTMCNNCHYYYSTWHADMSCASLSCHGAPPNNYRFPEGSNSIHGMGNNTGTSSTKTFNSDLVLNYKFENNLNDSGDWNMHGVWRVSSGSYVPGKDGNAIEVSDHPVEVGTRDASWSTDEGAHGTWKYTEMKNSMTLESWINPTDDTGERKIMAKHTFWNGGYALILKQIDGKLRVALQTNVNGGWPDFFNWDSDGCNGLRGAYSSVEIPMNEWTHVAATWDSTLPDADPDDQSVGRIRIYVNGHDVTTSNPPSSTECFAQPGVGEDEMYPESALNESHEDACYDGHWCASALSIAGLNWSAPDDNFVGKLDEIKVWNVTKDVDYFAPISGQVSPEISAADIYDIDKIKVAFSEPVYSDPGASGVLTPGDLVYTDADDGRTITAVDHAAGDSTAVITLSSPLDLNDDIGVDTVAAASNEIFDDSTLVMDTSAVTIQGYYCPCNASFQFNEPGGSAILSDETGWLLGTVSEPLATLLGDGRFHGDEVAQQYIDLDGTNLCLKDQDTVTMEARIYTDVIDLDYLDENSDGLDDDYDFDGDVFTILEGGRNSTQQRIYERKRNMQLTIQRANFAGDYVEERAGKARVIVKYFVNEPSRHSCPNAQWPDDTYEGADSRWHQISTDIDAYPLEQGRWYKIKVIFDSSDPIQPVYIFLDDQGVNGDDVGEKWPGYVNASQDINDSASCKWGALPGDRIADENQYAAIGDNLNHDDVAGDQNNQRFKGQIDWFFWSNEIE